ncbi:hypothetical protein EUGRSUZ_J02051 [Eucalyptus grandis]|uniref:Uncharacterized protein n=2 Tax=Eucalyptus grandis TaxID=71139 RepID=A0ACC3J819_EUCGR|nr:hypothetical protein EUGRSUZ_J02051 [Eucalyptus grandis]
MLWRLPDKNFLFSQYLLSINALLDKTFSNHIRNQTERVVVCDQLVRFSQYNAITRMIFNMARMVKIPIIIHKVAPSSPLDSSLAFFLILGFRIQIENEFPTFSKERVQLMCVLI